MEKAVNKLMNLIEILIIALLSLEVLVIVAQVIFRYIFRSPLSWSDQACRFGLVWIVMLGIPVMFHRKGTVAFDLIFSKTKGTTRKLFEIFFDICSAFLGITIFVCSIQYVQKCGGGSVPGCGALKFWMLYCSETVCGFLLILVCVKDILKGIRTFHEKDEKSEE